VNVCGTLVLAVGGRTLLACHMSGSPSIPVGCGGFPVSAIRGSRSLLYSASSRPAGQSSKSLRTTRTLTARTYSLPWNGRPQPHRSESCRSRPQLRLLIDANLSPRVAARLCAAGHDAVHMADCGLLYGQRRSNPGCCRRGQSDDRLGRRRLRCPARSWWAREAIGRVASFRRSTDPSRAGGPFGSQPSGRDRRSGVRSDRDVCAKPRSGSSAAHRQETTAQRRPVALIITWMSPRAPSLSTDLRLWCAPGGIRTPDV
jgi:hypothetical protein